MRHGLCRGMVGGLRGTLEAIYVQAVSPTRFRRYGHRYLLSQISSRHFCTSCARHVPRLCEVDRYRGTSLTRNTHPPRITIGP